MKRLVLLALVMGMAMPFFAQDMASAGAAVPEYRFASGNWSFVGSRLYQNDANARLAKVNFRVPQNGAMIYEFNVRYEGGAEDGHGGFGIHVFVDNAFHSASWGAGRSYLLWLNYDKAPLTSGIPAGLSAQVYRSISNSRMELLKSISLNEYLPQLMDNLSCAIPFKIVVDGNTGEIRVYDPTDPGMEAYLCFFIDKSELPLRGGWVALRTSGVKLSFGMGLEVAETVEAEEKAIETETEAVEIEEEEKTAEADAIA